MKHLKGFNEGLEDYVNDGERPLENLEDENDYLSEQNIKLQFNKWYDSIDYTEADYVSFKAGYTSAINNLEYFESREEREGTFDYFMTKSKEELLDYQKNFQHSFENPAEHDATFVAWKKACEIKKCFDKESYPHTRKESEFPSKMIY